MVSTGSSHATRPTTFTINFMSIEMETISIDALEDRHIRLWKRRPTLSPASPFATCDRSRSSDGDDYGVVSSHLYTSEVL